ncbi:major facilitator superfamily domain-containing protein [Hypoxylon trugodes]|uniref:major facilitator superfamily domain-containing protein n=1 Tax=Hypoxylon trugodes TaxID=326681 RepID=UPI00218D3B39|nr:major facilitator superfamily domain-containing protein [Hypoxylon trugodes]KAI1388371.1 major facilitator superfamily domain-containing protein [Hypoxylon trugodes]
MAENQASKDTSTYDSHSDQIEEKRKMDSNNDVEENEQHTDFRRGFRFWAIIIGLGITSLLGALENTVVTTSAPVIVSELQMGANYIWITNAFFVCSAAFQPLFGQLCNVFGRRWVTLAIIAIFTLGSGICGGANSGAMLIAGRAVQGIGSGGIMIITDIIVSDLVPLRQRGNYMAVILAIYGVGTTLGPFVGGQIVQVTTWRWVFYMNLPIGGVALVVMYACLHVNYNKEMTFTEKLKRLDLVGNGILIAATVAVLWALTVGGTEYSWGSWNILVPLIVGLSGLGLFATFEKWGWSLEPVMPPRLFGNRTSVIVSVNTLLYSALLYWIMYFMPVYFQAVKLYSPSYSGVALLPQSLVGIPGAAISAIVLSRWGRYKPLHFAGFAIFTLGIGLFAYLDADSSKAEWVIFQCVAALGAGLVLNTQLPAFQAHVPESDQAVATASWCFIRTFGNVWGVAIPGVIFNNRINQLLPRISDPNVSQLLANGDAYQYGSANFVGSFPQPTQGQIISVYRDALQLVFEVAIAFGGLTILLGLFEKEIPLRTELDTEFGLKDPSKKSVAKEMVDIEGNAGVSAEEPSPKK